jgi:glycosyltransferase involved in cell wall biosynthesis
MKAAFFRTDFYGAVNVGGSFSHVKGFLDGLRALGHDYFAISSGALPVDKDARLYPVPYSPLYRNLPEILSLAYNLTLERVARPIMQAERPDFIYHRHSEFNYATSVLKREFGIPLVLECNGSEVWIKKNWGKVYLEPLLRWAEEVQFAEADVITVVSDVMKQQLVDLRVPASKIVVNPNGVDTGLFRPGLDGGPARNRFGVEGKFVAGFVGTFGAWHGVDVLARSIKRAAELVPNIHYLVVGDGALRGEVERIIKEDGVGEHVTLTGSVAHDDIPSFLAACDVLLSPHVQNADGTVFFGSPTKLFEYMGMGLPIIASGVGQIGDIMQDGVNALMMRHRDHEHLAELLGKLSRDPDLSRRLGQKAREDAESKYAWRINASRVIDAVKVRLK